jgi:hypothetical protein
LYALEDERFTSGELCGLFVGTKYINDGVGNVTRIPVEDAVPVGWKLGTNRPTVSDRVWVSDEVGNCLYIKSSEEIPEGFFPGRASSPIKGTRICNNCKTAVYLSHNEEVPEGYIMGSMQKGKCVIIRELASGIIKRLPIEDTVPKGWVRGNIAEKTLIWVRHPHSGKRKRIGVDEEIPKGWVKGLRERSTTQSRVLVIDEIGNKKFIPFDDPLPSGFTLVATKPKKQPKNKWIYKIGTLTNSRIPYHKEVPDGWALGRVKPDKVGE